MTPFHWILLVWSIGTCVATLMMMVDYEDSTTYKKLVEEHSSIFSPRFLSIIFLAVTFLHSFFWWWITIPRLTFEWLRTWLIILIAKRILKMANSGRMDKVAGLMKIIKKVSPSDGKEEKQSEEKDVV